MTMFRNTLVLAAASAALAACATAPATQSGFLTDYTGLAKPGESLRASVRQKADPQALDRVRRVALEPAVVAPGADAGWLSAGEREMLLRELDAQVCFEISERFEITAADAADARVRTALTLVEPTGRVASAASAAASFFIPGPLGLRAPGTLGALGAESEMVDAATGAQLAAVTWARQATAVGTDNPSLSRIGDAMQFAEPFGDAVGRAMTPANPTPRKIEAGADPCAAFGPRFRPEGFLARFATGLYVPELSGSQDRSGAANTPTPAAP